MLHGQCRTEQPEWTLLRLCPKLERGIIENGEASDTQWQPSTSTKRPAQRTALPSRPPIAVKSLDRSSKLIPAVNIFCTLSNDKRWSPSLMPPQPSLVQSHGSTGNPVVIADDDEGRGNASIPQFQRRIRTMHSSIPKDLPGTASLMPLQHCN